MNSKINSAAADMKEVINEIDHALAQEKDLKTINAQKTESVNEQDSGLGSLSTLLRYIGSMTLIGSALTFLLQHWTAFGDHHLRYYSFLGFTVIITICGFFCGVKIKEDKGARAFLGLSAAIVPVHFAQLGAIVFSLFADPLYNYPEYLTWKAAGPLEAVLTTTIGVTTVSLITCVSLYTLSRKAMLHTAGIYIFLSSFLLLPFRDAGIIGLMLLVMGAGTVFSERYLASKFTSMRTNEGKFIRLMLVSPLLLLLGRTLALYSYSITFSAAIFALIALMLFVYLPRLTTEKYAAAFWQQLSMIPSSIACLQLISELIRVMPGLNEMHMLIAGVSYAGILLIKSIYAIRGDAFKKIACLILLSTVALQSVLYSTWYYALICIVFSIIIAAYSHLHAYKGIKFISIGAFALGLLHYLRYAADLYLFSPWLSLAIVGISTIFISSYIERYKSAIKAKFNDFFVK